MGTMKDIIEKDGDFKSFARSYVDYISQLLAQLDMGSLEALWCEIEEARLKGRKLFVIGNGGSAATASHLANDFAIGARGFVDLPFKVISLTDNTAVMTAVANDLGYDRLFVRQLETYYDAGDKLLVISASGNSPNLVMAAEWVKAQGGRVLGFLGFDGGRLKDLCDNAVVVRTPRGEYGPVEDVHMILDHLLFSWNMAKGGQLDNGV